LRFGEGATLLNRRRRFAAIVKYLRGSGAGQAASWRRFRLGAMLEQDKRFTAKTPAGRSI
jgi:hypothetical protein